MNRGLFITIEGIDGSGKSTHAAMLADYLAGKDIPVKLTREPGGTPIGEQVRNILLDKANRNMMPMTEALLYAASRAQHVAEVIRPSIEAGYVVICDRFIDSSLAYQGYARGLGIDTIARINEYALDGMWPDITLFLDITPEIAMNRIEMVGETDRLEAEGIELLKSVYEGYKILARLYPKRFNIIDASRELLDVQKSILAVIEPKLISIV